MIEPFDREKHAAKIASWHVARDSEAQAAIVGHPRCYPQLGFVGEALATWCYRTDGPYLLVDHTIGDPNATHELRAAEFAEAMEAVTAVARKEGYGAVITMTPIDKRALAAYLETIGFQDLNPATKYSQFVKVV